jgi:hypothetical protein
MTTTQTAGMGRNIEQLSTTVIYCSNHVESKKMQQQYVQQGSLGYTNTSMFRPLLVEWVSLQFIAARIQLPPLFLWGISPNLAVTLTDWGGVEARNTPTKMRWHQLGHPMVSDISDTKPRIWSNHLVNQETGFELLHPHPTCGVELSLEGEMSKCCSSLQGKMHQN